MPDPHHQIADNIARQAADLLDEGALETCIEVLRVGATAFPGAAILQHQLGRALARSGDMDGALGHYLRALEIDPGHRPTVLDCFRVFCRAGDHEDAMDLAAAYVDFCPEDRLFTADLPDTRNHHGQGETPAAARLAAAIADHQAGDLAAAEKGYLDILGAGDHADALHLYGFIAYQRGHHNLAAHFIERAIQVAPDSPQFHNHLGLAMKSAGRLPEAVKHYGRAVFLAPDYAQAHCNLGDALAFLGRLEEAGQSYCRAVDLNPDYFQAVNNMGAALEKQGRREDALAAYRRALALCPGYSDALFNLGNLLVEKGNPDEAAALYRKALETDPDNPALHFNLGNARQVQRRYDEAIGCYQRAFDLKPGYFRALDNMGKAYQDMGQPEDAIQCYDRSLAICPENSEARFDRALLFLLTGQFEKGWPEYEVRFDLPDRARVYPHRLTGPRWDGRPFPGKRLLVHCEQGYGDNIQFVRYLPFVKKLGGTVIFETLQPLQRLFEQVPGIDERVVHSSQCSPEGDWDIHCPLLSLPGLLGTDLEHIPAEIPYLLPAQDLAMRWHKRLATDALRVGVVWAGKPTNKDDCNRSVDLALFKSLSKVPGVRFYSLQKGPEAKQADLPENRGWLTNIGRELTDFYDTAAVIAGLDLVISVDTAVVPGRCHGAPGLEHDSRQSGLALAAQQGRQSLVSLFAAFRRGSNGDWGVVFEDVKTALRHWAVHWKGQGDRWR